MQISDDLFLGPALGPNPNFGTDGNPAPMSQGVGPMGRVFVFDVVPAAAVANNIAASQNPVSGGVFTLAAGAGVTARTRPDGTIEMVLDTPRAVSITATGANTAIYRVEGFDAFGQFMSQLLAAPSTSTVTTLKAFRSVNRIVNTNATAGTNGLTVGTSTVLGLPVRVTAAPYIISPKWDTALADDAGTFVPAVTTDPATNLTGDVRGTYVPTSAPNGVRRLVMAIAIPAIGSGPQATRIGAFGVTQA
jgi:hypothetical protein